MNDNLFEFPPIKWEDVDTSDEYLSVEELREAVRRVRDTHRSMTHIYGKVACTECGQKYPCRTIKAISLLEDN
jgi:hypothetical protein